MPTSIPTRTPRQARAILAAIGYYYDRLTLLPAGKGLAGRELLPTIVDVLESINRLKAAAGDQLATRRLLRIGTVNAGTASLVLPAVRAFQDQHPASTIEIRNLQQDEIHLGLADGTL